jgi:anti-sigma factor (TIGR02949 family)
VTCADAEPLIEAYLDGEVDAARAAELETHFSTCTNCTAKLETMQALSQELRAAPYFRAPASLRQRLAPQMRARRFTNWRAAGLAAAAVFLVGATTMLLWRPVVPGGDAAIADAVTSNHVRSLMASHLFDVASSDRHTVKPWFAGRLEFSPTVIDLANDGFPLLGGRLDYVDGHPAAAVVYKRRDHVINVFIWPAAGEHPRAVRDDARGYHLVTWTHGGMTYWAVSDLAKDELNDFAARLAAAIAASGS